MDSLASQLDPTRRSRTSTLITPTRPSHPAPSSSENGHTGEPKDTVSLSSERREGDTTASLTARKLGQWAGVSSKGEGVQPDPHFQYNARPLQDLRGSVHWTPGSSVRSGTEANQQVTSDYEHLNTEMQRYLAGDPNGRRLPAVTDFAGMAKFGSRLAGEQIRNLEDLEKGAAGDPRAATDVMRNMANPTAIEQGAKMGGATLVRNAADENPLLTAVAPLPLAGKVAGESTVDAVRTMGKMRDILVEGNTTIHDSAGRAYDAFLKGESSGEGGLEALEKAGYYPGSKEDPMGMYTQAFGAYKQARELGLQAQSESNPEKRKALLEQREELMKGANQRLFIHEQESLERPHMYGDADMKNAVRSIGGSMTLDDPHGKYDLLPQGGDWTDFQTRMGFQEVDPDTPGAIDMLQRDGSHKYYKADPSAIGTVSHYSNSRTAGPLAEAMSSTQPAPLIQSPTTETGRGVDRVGAGLAEGSFHKTVGAAAQLPERLATDGLLQGGQALKNHAFANGFEAYQVLRNHSEDKPGLGDDITRLGAHLRIAGAGLDYLGGEAVSALGELGQTTLRGRDALWNATLGKLLD